MNPDVKSLIDRLAATGKRRNIPNISLETAHIISFFLCLSAARCIFEIGCANGFSTIFLADHVRRLQGMVVTCDISEPSFAEARANLKKSGLEQYVDFRFGDALQILQSGEYFDFIFIDGQKNRTHEFFLLAVEHLTGEGIILIDDTKKFPEKMQDFSALREERRDFIFLDIPTDADDAVTVAFRKQ